MYTTETVGRLGRFVWRHCDCGKKLTGRRDQKACSVTCRVRAWRAKRGLLHPTLILNKSGQDKNE